MADTKKKAKKMLSSFTILFIILLVVALVCLLFLRKSYDTEKQALLKNK